MICPCLSTPYTRFLMGKHDRELEEYAEFITRTVEEDGIAYAMERLGLCKKPVS